MEDLIGLYLFRNKKCPVPSIGFLKVIENHATIFYRDGKIEPPLTSIKLINDPIPDQDFLRFIASKKNISIDEANGLLNQFGERLQHMGTFDETVLPSIGKFYVNAEGNLVFKPIDLPHQFLPVIKTEEVIHPPVAHLMVVGDKESTTTEMAAFYSETGAKINDRWWIWATCLAIIAAAMLFFHYNDKGQTIEFGNSRQIEILQPAKTYFIAE